jgi:hypothetical protein
VIAETAECERQIKARQDEFEKRKAEEEQRRREESKIVLSLEESSQLASARLLIPRRVFSADRLLGDVEQYLPKDARILGLKVGSVTPETAGIMTDVEISALGKTAAQLTEMLSLLEKSNGLFMVVDALQSQAADTGEIPFTIRVNYRGTRGASE